MKRVQTEVNRREHPLDTLHLVTLHFDGTMEKRALEKGQFKGKLFFARAGDVLYSKIDVRNGAIGIVPIDMPYVAVSSEFPVYSIDSEKANSQYVKLLFHTNFFRQTINSMISGASGRKRVQPSQIEELKVPLPPLPIQEAIVARWVKAQEGINAAYSRVEQHKISIEARFFHDLGLEFPEIKERPKVFAVLWNDFRRWSVNYNQAAQRGADITQGHYAVIPLDSILETVQYGTSEKANSTADGIPVIRMNNIVEGLLDLSKLKHVKLSKKEQDSLLLKDGDILFNRTNSKELVGKCAVFHGEDEYVFASYLIRIRVDTGQANPDFVAYAINSRIGRQQIDALSRQIIGQANVNSEELRELSIPLPPRDVQNSIMSRVQEGLSEIARERAAAEQKAHEVKAEIEALILGTKSIEDTEIAA
jgi:type I restriction enzyme S subunit